MITVIYIKSEVSMTFEINDLYNCIAFIKDGKMVHSTSIKRSDIGKLNKAFSNTLNNREGVKFEIVNERELRVNNTLIHYGSVHNGERFVPIKEIFEKTFNK